MCDKSFENDSDQVYGYAMKLDVKNVKYSVAQYCEHSKALVVTYHCEDNQTLREFYLFGVNTPRAAVAREWWRERAGTPPPSTPQEAFRRCNQLRSPKSIVAHFVGELDRIESIDGVDQIAKNASNARIGSARNERKAA